MVNTVILFYRLAGCCLSDQHCESLSSALQSSNSHLRELDLSNNDLQDSGVKLLSDGLRNSHSQLNILRSVFHINLFTMFRRAYVCFINMVSRYFMLCILLYECMSGSFCSQGRQCFFKNNDEEINTVTLYSIVHFRHYR